MFEDASYVEEESALGVASEAVGPAHAVLLTHSCEAEGLTREASN